MQQTAPGAMLSVPLCECEAAEWCGDSLDIEAVNGPRPCIIGGDVDSVNAAIAEPILGQFREVLKRVKLHAPRVPFLFCLTGDWICEEEATEPEYWVSQLR